MSDLGLFRGARGGRQVLRKAPDGQCIGIEEAPLKFLDRVVHSIIDRKIYYGDDAELAENWGFRQEFHTALAAATTPVKLSKVIHDAKLPPSWHKLTKSMSGRRVTKILLVFDAVHDEDSRRAYMGMKYVLSVHQDCLFQGIRSTPFADVFEYEDRQGGARLHRHDLDHPRMIELSQNSVRNLPVIHDRSLECYKPVAVRLIRKFWLEHLGEVAQRVVLLGRLMCNDTLFYIGYLMSLLPRPFLPRGR